MFQQRIVAPHRLRAPLRHWNSIDFLAKSPVGAAQEDLRVGFGRWWVTACQVQTSHLLLLVPKWQALPLSYWPHCLVDIRQMVPGPLFGKQRHFKVQFFSAHFDITELCWQNLETYHLQVFICKLKKIYWCC